ncbi:TRAP transporter substrate-binding protein [Salibacterium aidingense]|uniref:TRAP transporter substrate-binding protein n=1 Tax=Salibacterium aidingense TaxID=384933 RepID=UPI0004193690|nr:TRAP transporter substrate-binding protein [Salibacterium aidingense]
MKLSNFLLSSVTAISLSLLGACGNEENTSDGQTDSNGNEEESQNEANVEEASIRIGNFYNENTTYGQAFNQMKEDIESASDGAIEVEIFHGGSLGSEQDHIEAVHEGSLEMMHSGTAGIGRYIPETAIFELWYNFTSLQQLQTAFEELTPDLDEMYQEEGFKLLGAYYDGPRNILTTEKITSAGDMQGVDFRVPDSTLYVDMAEALGSNAITMPYGDVYTSLQTGAIQAMEGTADSVIQEGFYEQADYYIQDNHVYQPLSIVYNLEAWENLSSEQQEIIENAVSDATEYHLELVEEANNEALTELEENGIELVEIEDQEEWRSAVEEANQNFAEEYGETGEMILNTMQETMESSDSNE